MRKSLVIATLFTLIGFSCNSMAGRLPTELRLALAKAGIAKDQVGLVVQAVGQRKPSTTLNANQPLNPASVMKTLTTLAALDTFGPAHTFKTRVLVDGSVNDGVLHGNLVLQGGGDPGLNLERFLTMLREIRLRGIRAIDGDVIIDNSFFAIDLADPGAFDGEPLKPYNASPTALLVNYNALPVRLAPGKDSVAVQLDPPSLPVDNGLSTDSHGVCGDWQDGLVIKRDGDRLNLLGSYPVACGDRTLWLNLMCPPATAAALFRADWTELGGTLSGQIRLADTPATAVPLFDYDSPELSELVRLTNKYSNNVMAKMLFLDLGAARFGAPATWEKGQKAVRDWLAEKGLDMPELVIENGSGLSRDARISAGSVASLLVWASKQPIYYEFAASLPALGLEGTQRHRLKDSPLAGRAWLKSGSLDGIHNLAGYVLDADGRRKVVVLFIQSATGDRAAVVQAAVLNWAIDKRHALH